MSPSFEEVLRRYHYTLPPDLIAQAPASPRDASRLLTLDRVSGEISASHFRDVGSFLPARSMLVLNETKVIPARLFLMRGDQRVGALWVGTTAEGLLRVLAKGTFHSGEVLTLTPEKTCTVHGRSAKELLLKPSFPLQELQAILMQYGSMPLPPYIDRSPLTEEEIKERYQAVFARNPGSIAAPTASLHFTPELLLSLEQSGITFARVTLHVHLGTFSPLTEQQWENGALHTEQYHMDAADIALLEHAKAEKCPIIPVGTTALRTLESAFDDRGICVRPEGETNLFIREGYSFKMADALITNFHVPKSSLLMLVCAFGGYEHVMEAYAYAKHEKFRFFSFGDAMLIR